MAKLRGALGTAVTQQLESTVDGIDREHGDGVVAAVRGVEEATGWMDVDVGGDVRALEVGWQQRIGLHVRQRAVGRRDRVRVDQPLGPLG
jgi:hypothetical protein